MKHRLLSLLFLCLMAMTGHAAINYSLNESFESGIPATWTQEVLVSGSPEWIADTLSTNPTGAADGNGRVAFRNMSDQSDGTYVTRLITPAMDLSGVSSPVLTLAYAQPMRPGMGNDQLKIYYRLTESSDWVLLKSYEEAQGSWKRDTIALIATSQGTAYQLAFEGNDKGGVQRGIVLDDVKVFPESQCSAAPEGLAAIPDATAALISWTRINDGRTYEVVVSSAAITDFEDLSGAVFHQSGISNRNVTATGLTAQNHYYAYIRSTCDDNESGYSAWSSAAEFDTPCEAIASFPWVEDFESYTSGTFSADCWINEHISGTGSSKFSIYTSGNGTNSTKQLQLPDMSSGTLTKLVLPVFAIDEADAYAFALDVYRNAYSYAAEGIRVYVSNSTNIDEATELAFISRNYTVANGSIPAESASGWYTYEMNIPLSGNVYIILRGESQYGSSTYMDNFKVRKLPDCRKVSSLNVSNVAGTSAVINFGVFAAAQNYQVVVATEALTLSGDPTDAQLAKIVYNNSEITASGVNVEGLTSATTYYVYARALCGGEETGEWSTGISFTTLCEMPWKESFEGITSGVPAGWDNSQGTTTSASYKWSSYSTGYNGRGLRFDSYSNSNGNTNTLVTPSVYLSENAILSFYWKNSVGGDAKLYVSQDGGSTKDEITSVNLVGVADWTQFTVDLSAYTGNSVTVYFASTSNYGATGAYHYLDEVSIRKIPTCKDINSVVVSGISNNGAKVVFSNTVAANYQVIVATEAVADPETLDASKIIINDATLTDTIAEVTGLTANTTYYAYVRGVCDSENKGAWANAVAFTTACDPITIASKDEPWIEDFESYDASSSSSYSASYKFDVECWNHQLINGSNYFHVYKPTSGTNTTKQLCSKESSGLKVLLALPSMHFEEANAYAFSFDMNRTSNYASYADSLYIYANTSAALDGSEVLLAAIPRVYSNAGINVPAESEAGWKNYEFIIPVAGNGNIILYVSSKNGDPIYLDNLKVRKLPDCRDMGVVAAKAVKSHGATINFPANGAANYQIVMATESIDPTYVDSTEVPASIIYNRLVSATSNVIEDAAIFAANTDYYVYVRAYCGVDEQGKWSKEVSFHTLCEPYSVEEFGLEDFTDKDRIHCWTLGFSTEGTSASYAYAKRDSSEAYGAYIRLSKENASDSYSDGAYAVTPELTIEDLKQYEVSFSAATTNSSATSNMKKLHVGVVTNPSDPNTFQTLKTFTLDYAADSTAEKTYVVSLAGAEPDEDDNYPHYIFFMAAESNEHDSTNYVLIDNVSFSLLSTCAQVIESSVSNLSTSGARVSWEDVEAGSYEVFVSDINSREPDTLTAISRQTVSTLHADFSGLEQNTAYYAYVRGICGEGDTAKWSNAIAFQTTIGLPYMEPFKATTLNEGWKVYNSSSSASDSVNIANFNTTGTYKWQIVSSSAPAGMEGSIAQFTLSTTYTSVYTWLVSPTIDLAGHEDDFIELSFKMAGSNLYSTGVVAVYVSNDGAQSFKKLATIAAADLSASAADFTCKLTKFAGQKINLAFYAYQYYSSYSQDGYPVVSLDDVSVHTYEAVCKGVENLNVALNGMTIDASWEIEGTPVKTIVELSDDANFATFIDSVVVENALTHQFTGLQLSKTYYVRARQADCADAKWVVSAAIKTPIGVPYSEAFEGSSIPSDWSKFQGTPASAFAGTAPSTTTGGWTLSSTSTGLPANHVKVNAYYGSSYNNMWLVSPAIDMTSIQATDSVVLSFDFAYTAYNSATSASASSDQALLLLVSTDGGNTWSADNGYEWSHTDSIVANVSKTLASIPTTGTTITLTDFARFAGHSIKFAFVATATSGDNDFHIDNVSLKQIIADCDDPTELALEGGDRQIAVTWSGDEAKPSIIQWSKTSDFASFKADTIESGLAYTIESLDPATTYYVRVQQICAAGNTDFTSVLSAATDCEAIAEFPWNEDFSGFASGTLANPCWKNQHTAGTATKLFSISSESLYLPDMQTGNRTLLALPEMSISEADAFAFVLDVKRESSSKPQEGIVIYASQSDTIDASAVRLAHIIRAFDLGNDTVPAEAASGWYNYEFAIPMSGTVRILIEGISEYGNSTYMDNFKVYSLPSCRQVKGVAASEIGADSAVVSFKKTAAPQYQVVATIAAINPDTLENVADTLIVFNQTVSEDTLVISALQPQTDYYVYVRGLCDDEDFGAWSDALKMKTACGVISTFPWKENFDGSTTLSECWNLVKDGNYPSVSTSSSYAHSGSNSFNWGTSYTSSDQYRGWLVLPEMDADLKAMRLTLWARCGTSYGSSYYYETADSVIVGVMDSPTDTASFVRVDAFMPTTTYAQYEIDLSSYAGSGKFITILRQPLGDRNGKAYEYGYYETYYYCLPTIIDDVELSFLPACRDLKGLAVKEIASSSAKATWKPSNAGQYQVILANAEIAPSYVDSVSGIDAAKLVRIDTVADASIDYTALTPATDYYVYVRGLCDENEKSIWGSASFKTQCLVDVPYLMDFDDAEDRKVSYVSYGTSYMIPSCFNAIAGGSGYPARVYDESEENTSSYTYSYAHSGTSSLRIYSSSTSPQFVTLPEMNQRTDTLALTFKARALYAYTNTSSGSKSVSNDATSTYAHALKIGTMADPMDTASFQLIETVVLTEIATTPSSTSDDPMGNNYWETFTVYLTGATGKFIAFASDFSSSNYVWIDDVQVDFVPDCRVPAQINIVPGRNTADVTWVGTAEGYELALGAQGFSLPAGADSIYTLDTAFLHIEELSANTAYDLYLRSACDEGLYSAWSKVASFRTECDVYALPFSENFNALESGIPTCWDNSEGTTTTESYKWNYYVDSPDTCLRFNSFSNSNGNTNILVTPDIVLSDDAYLSFRWKNPAGGDAMVLVAKAGNSKRDTLLTELKSISSWTEFRADLTDYTGDTVNLYFHATSNWGNGTAYLFLDDVNVTLYPACRDIETIDVLNVTNTSATASWTKTNALQYQVILANAAITPADIDGDGLDMTKIVSIDTVDVNNIEFSGLTAQTSYYVYLRGFCADEEKSAWSKACTFTTDCDAIATFPWSENFDSRPTGNFAPSCWTNERISGSGSYIFSVISGSSASATSNVIGISSYQSATNVLLSTPVFDIDEADAYAFSFSMYRRSASSYPNEGVRVYASNASQLDESAVELGFIHHDYLLTPAENAVGWYNYEYDIPITGNVHIFVVAECTNGYAMYLDDFRVRKLPSCKNIRELKALEVATDTAVISFLSSGATAYELVVASAAIDPDSAATRDLDKVILHEVALADTAAIVRGLSASTEYFAYVRGLCDEDTHSERWTSTSFYSACGIIATFPWKEDFEAYTSGTFSAVCWINEHITGSGSSTFSIYTSSNGGNSTKQLYLPDMYSGTLTKLVLPGMAIPEANAYGFSIDVYRNATGYAAEGIRVYASASAEIDENAIELAFISRNYAVANDTIPAENASGWYTYELPIPMSGDMHIIIRGENKYGAATYMDNFRVRLLPTCEKVTDVEASEITTSSATISFPATNAANYHVIVASKALDLSKELSAADSAKIVYDDATLTETIAEVTGLTANTLYYAYARGLCEDEDGEWSAGISFRTECGAFALPYSQNFDNSSDRKEIEGTSSYLPLCWNEGHVSTSNLMAISAYSYDEDYAFSGSYALDVNTTASNSAYAVLPLVETNGENGVELSFEARALYSSEGYDYDWGYYEDVYNYATSSYAHSIKVGLMSDPSDISTFSLVEEVKLTEIASTPSSVSDDPNGREYWENHTVRLDAPAGKYIAFVSDFSKANRVWIDDIRAIEYNASCQGVNGIEVSNVSISGFDVAFHYNEAGDNSARIAVSATETLNIDNVLLLDTIDNDSVYSAVVALASGRPFYVFVQQFCGEDGTSAWEMAQIQTPYMVRYEPVFSSTTLPSDWNRYSGLMDQVLDGTTQLSSTTSGWYMTAANAIINSTHFYGDIYGGSFNYWVVTPTIDLTPNVGDGLLLSFEAGLTPYSSTYADKRNDGVDDRFAVLVTTDDGATWTKVAEWNNYATGDFVYNDVPEDGASYQLNLSNFAGEHVRIAFYGESTVSNADNYFHFGNIVLDKCVAKTYTDHVCSGDDYDGSQAAEPNPFVISADQYKIGLNVFSEFRPSTGAGDVDSMIILNLYVHDYFTTDLYATVCEGSHYGPDENGFEFDAEVGMNDKRKILTSSIGCDSIIILHITVNQAITVHIEDSVEQGKAYEWNGKEYYTEGTYQFTTESEITGCDSTTVLHLTTYQGEGPDPHEGVAEVGAQKLIIAPNPVRKGEPIIVLNDFSAEQLADAKIAIYTASGSLCYAQQGAQKPFIIPAIGVSGIYHVRVVIGDEVFISTLIVQ